MTAQNQPGVDAAVPPAGVLPSDRTSAAPDVRLHDAPIAMPSATERLEQSRERIRAYFDSRRPRARRAAEEAGETPEWLEKLRANPLFDGVADAVGGWWRSHPLYSVFTVGESALREGLSPVARRHPIALAAGAVVLGALLYRTRLLRRLLKPALFAGLATQIATRVIARIPLDSVLSAFSRFREPAMGDDVPPAAPAGFTPPSTTDPNLPGATPGVAIHPPVSPTHH